MRLIFSTSIGKPDFWFNRIMLPSFFIILIVSTLVQCDDVCTTSNCYEIAEILEASMVPDVDPCDDFAKHVCGNWVYDPTGDTASEVVRIQSDALTEPINDDDIEAVRKAKAFFQACRDDVKRDERGVTPLLNFVNTNGGWPLISPEWIHDHPTLQQIHEKYATTALVWPLFEILFDFPPADFVGDYNNYRYQLTIPDVHWEQEKNWENRTADPVLYEQPEWFNEYFIFIKSIATAFARASYSSLPNTIDRDIEDMIKFEAKLDALWRTLNSDLANMTLTEVQKAWDTSIGNRKDLSINWSEVIVGRMPIPYNTSQIDSIGVAGSVEFLPMLVTILKEFPLKTIVNYIHWQLISDYLIFLDSETRDYDDRVKQDLFGESAKIGRNADLSCIPLGIKHAASYVAMDKVHVPESTQIIQNIFDEIQNEIGREIQESKWPTGRAKKKLIQYIEATKKRIGFPKFFNDPEKLNRMYEQLDISDNYFENIVHIKKFNDVQAFKRMVKKSSAVSNTFKIKSTIVNAAFYGDENSITIPEAQFLMPIFAPDVPSFYIYGRLGAIVGHELTHAFNDMEKILGSKNLRNWARITLKRFKEKEQCFIDQFDPFGKSYGIMNGTEYYRPGALTLDENVADHGGLKASYAVFQQLKSTGQLENAQKLPNFEGYSDEQMFFYSNGMDLCAWMYDPLTERIAADMHAPQLYRLLGSLQNMKEFADAFKCRPKTKMNPEKKCVLWE